MLIQWNDPFFNLYFWCWGGGTGVVEWTIEGCRPRIISPEFKVEQFLRSSFGLIKYQRL